MADNPTIDNGSLTDYAVSADEGSGGYVQRVKLAYSADGSETHVTADADGLLVNLGANNDVSITGTVAVTDNSGSLTVDNAGTFAVQAAQSGTWNITNVSGTVSLPTGAATAAKQPALGTAGTPSADVLTVQGITSMTALKVDGSAVTQPVSGTVTANLAAGTNNIGDVDVLSIAAGDNNIGNVDIVTVPAPLSTTGGGTEAAALRVTLASDSTGLVSVDDNGSTLSVDDGGGTLTVDGTVAVSGSVAVTDNSGSLTVDAPVGTPVFVRLSDGASAISTLPVSLATVPSHAVTNAGTFAVQVDGAALTALQLIDNPVIVDDAAFTPATSSVMMAGFEYDDTTPDSVNEGDAGAARMSANRNIYVQIRDNAGNERGLNVDASGNIGVGSIVSALPAGTNAIGKLAANSGVDIGDVDVTSVTPGTGATSLGKAEDGAHTTGDVGVMALSVRKDTPSQLAGTDADYAPILTDATGAVWTRNLPATAASVSAVTDAATNQTLLSASTTRKGFRIQNDSDQVLYIKYGTTASTTDYTTYLLPGAVLFEDNYNGNVDGIWAANSSGSARVTSLT